jgi:hypothetical protein
MSTAPWIVAFGSLILLVNAYPCRRTSPVSNVEMIKQANVICRVQAVEYATAPRDPNLRTTGEPDSTIRFKVLEVI